MIIWYKGEGKVPVCFDPGKGVPKKIEADRRPTAGDRIGQSREDQGWLEQNQTPPRSSSETPTQASWWLGISVKTPAVPYHTI